MRFLLCCTAIVCSYGFGLNGIGHAAEPVDTRGPLTIQSEGSFFIGGTVHHADELSGMDTGPDVTRAGDVTTGQMYVQYQIPVVPKHLPVVMIHGGGLSGQTYETTPDGRMGGANTFYALAGQSM